jgi:hypothetical protein
MGHLHTADRPIVIKLLLHPGHERDAEFRRTRATRIDLV